MSRLQNKVVLINGASSGFGRASAILFASEGATVVIADITEKALAGGFEADIDQTTADVIKSKGGEAIFCQCDVTKESQVTAAVQAAVDNFGRL
ncbi:hypothetical protein KCU90_g16724, partial [Aureobasidium melanogenum]